MDRVPSRQTARRAVTAVAAAGLAALALSACDTDGYAKPVGKQSQRRRSRPRWLRWHRPPRSRRARSTAPSATACHSAESSPHR